MIKEYIDFLLFIILGIFIILKDSVLVGVVILVG